MDITSEEYARAALDTMFATLFKGHYISNGTARYIAENLSSQFKTDRVRHFVRTGAISLTMDEQAIDFLNEILIVPIPEMKSEVDQRMATQLGRYLSFRIQNGLRGPVEGWSILC